ncbi:hypothetical protein N7524_011388 [Penicillium chrysogenum]|nr:hypothetical protein N7524_011388 [Penicillium chrysogenum]
MQKMVGILDGFMGFEIVHRTLEVISQYPEVSVFAEAETLWTSRRTEEAISLTSSSPLSEKRSQDAAVRSRITKIAAVRDQVSFFGSDASWTVNNFWFIMPAVIRPSTHVATPRSKRPRIYAGDSGLFPYPPVPDDSTDRAAARTPITKFTAV